jgi:hypothetical protein
MVTQTSNPSTQETEAGESRVWGQSGPHSKILFQKQTKAKKDHLWQIFLTITIQTREPSNTGNYSQKQNIFKQIQQKDLH